MGGDDLSDDDEYLDYSPSGDGHSSDDGNGGGGNSKKKRKGDGNSSLSDDDDDNDDDVKVHNEKKTDRKKRNKTELLTSSSSSSSLQDVLLHAGRGIAMDGLEAQSTFLNTLYSHSIKLVSGAASNSKKVVEEEDEEEEEPSSTTDITTTAITTYSFLPHLYTLPKELDMSTKVYRHANLNSFLKPSSSGNGGGPLSSNKKLKNWKYPYSPMIIVITLSAIRAVELMKQLSSTIKLPMLKLFAKHMSLDEQVRLLSQGFWKKKNIDNKQTTKNLSSSSSSSSKKGSKGSGGYYSLAVGTPGRLLKLLRENNNDTTTNTDDLSRGGDMGNSARRGGGALQLHHTELIIIDCHTDSKGWNVCTLNDTSTELMQFMNEGVINQLEKRKGKIKLALF
jgi:hypothetical protein